MKKKIIFIFVVFVVWFLVADAYWVAKQRAVAQCANNPFSVELILEHDQNLSSLGSDFALRRARLEALSECSLVEGAGHAWFSAKGLSYAEIVLLLPVGNRIAW